MPSAEPQTRSQKYPPLSRRRLLCAQGMGLAGVASVVGGSLVNWESPDLLKYGAFLTVGIFSSGAAIDVPSVTRGVFPHVSLRVVRDPGADPAGDRAARRSDDAGALLDPIAPTPAGPYHLQRRDAAVVAAAVAHGVYHGSWLAAA